MAHLKHFTIGHDQDAIDSFPQRPVPSQAKIYKGIVSGELRISLDAFFKRLAHFFKKGTFEQFVPHICSIYPRINKDICKAAAFSHLRAVCNQWCTSSRFGNNYKNCLDGCGCPKDNL